MAELITEEQPRIKFRAEREGAAPDARGCSALADLALLMSELESAGVIPVLNDGLVAGNCAIAVAACEPASSPSEAGSPAAGDSASDLGGAMWVSRSGKAPGALMSAGDFVLVTGFDRNSWCARYQSATEAARPTSDTPLHCAALMTDARAAYGWAQASLVAVHGHALAEGTGLELAERLKFPVSQEATLFSTPADLRALEQLFAEHPYPQHRCYIRRGHGFFLLGQNVQEVRDSWRTLILPHLESLAERR